MKSTFEKMGGTYTLGADGIYYPNLISTDEEPHYGKYSFLSPSRVRSAPKSRSVRSDTSLRVGVRKAPDKAACNRYSG